jgi:hypothetical protein
MTESYVRTKVKEALQAAGDDKREAQKLLITWAVRDQPLLLGLAKPHLKAIVASHIENALRPPKKTETDRRDPRFSKDEIDALIAARPLGEKRSPIVPPPKSSTRQASVMNQLAAAFKKKEK